jgi:hypothetical protein
MYLLRYSYITSPQSNRGNIRHKDEVCEVKFHLHLLNNSLDHFHESFYKLWDHLDTFLALEIEHKASKPVPSMISGCSNT